jgi:hypothetical protein
MTTSQPQPLFLSQFSILVLGLYLCLVLLLFFLNEQLQTKGGHGLTEQVWGQNHHIFIILQTFIGSWGSRECIGHSVGRTWSMFNDHVILCKDGQVAGHSLTNVLQFMILG